MSVRRKANVAVAPVGSLAGAAIGLRPGFELVDEVGAPKGRLPFNVEIFQGLKGDDDQQRTRFAPDDERTLRVSVRYVASLSKRDAIAKALLANATRAGYAAVSGYAPKNIHVCGAPSESKHLAIFTVPGLIPHRTMDELAELVMGCAEGESVKLAGSMSSWKVKSKSKNEAVLVIR